MLLVEDEELVRKYATRGLRERGYDVLSAADAEEALQIADQHHRPIDALVTDLVLPRMDGAALARELTRRRPSLRVLFVSGYPTDVIERRGDVAATTLLSKPYTLDQLALTLERVLKDRV